MNPPAGASIPLFQPRGAPSSSGLMIASRPLIGSLPSRIRTSPLGGCVPGATESDTTTAATSSAEISRLWPAEASAAASASSCVRPVLATIRATVSAVIPVSTKLGQTAFTVTPVPATSAAADRVRPTSACLAAE